MDTMIATKSSNLLHLKCVSVRKETDDIKTFSFEAAEPVDFHAGQALTFALEIDGQLLYRTFSISSRPGHETINVTIKAHQGGKATPWLHDNLKAGGSLQSLSPKGRFTIGLRQLEKLAFVSAGSGVTPLFAMLEHLSEVDPEADVAWVHASRKPSDLLFAARLTEIQGRMPNLAVSLVVSNPTPGWSGYRGRLSRRMMSVIVPDFARRQVFSCGPIGFMDEIRLIHAAEGGDPKLFHTESFGGAVAETLKSDVAGSSSDIPTTQLTVGTRVLTVRGGESVLQACLRQSVIIPCGCGQGMCGTCRIKKVSGEVTMNHQGGITPEEESEGYILACCSKPRGNIEIAR